MARFAVDAATLLHLVRQGVRVDPAHQLVAPNATRSQALQRLLDEVRTGTVTERQALEWHEGMTGQRMRLLGDRVSRRTAWRLARELDLPIVDAEVLAVATLQADALVTVDAELARTASAVVRLAEVEDLTHA